MAYEQQLADAEREIATLRKALDIAHKWMASRQPVGDDAILAMWRREMKLIEDALGKHRTGYTVRK